MIFSLPCPRQISLPRLLGAVWIMSAAGVAQVLGPATPLPSRMAHLQFYSSIAEALNAGRGKQPILVYTVHTLAARNRIDWMIQQHAIWSHPLTKKVLRGLPIVALGPQTQEARKLRVPGFGIALLSPDGRRVERTIEFDRVKVAMVPALLAEILTPNDPLPEDAALAGIDASAEFSSFRTKRAKIFNLIDGGRAQAAAAIVEKQIARAPNGIGPRLLEFSFRHAAMAADYFKRDPHHRATLDLVCIVDDDDSFLRALEGWGAGPIYPILYRDSHYLPLFLAAFQPARIVLVHRNRKNPASPQDQKRLMKAYGRAFGAAPTSAAITATKRWKTAKGRSPGIVWTHPKSPMMAAGLALAAGRRQLLAMQPPVADPTKRVSQIEMLALRARLRQYLVRHGIDGLRLFDELDFVTLATELPFRYSDRLAVDKSTYALDDAIARDRFDLPYAFVGRLLGDRSQSLYMAMCALFLAQPKTLLFSRYQKTGNWAYYGTSRAVPLLDGKCTLTHIEHPAATLAKWQSMFAGRPNDHSLIHVNSSGGRRNWSTSAGNGSYDDIPLTTPTVVSYVHSNSLGNGYDPDTVGGRWLHNGAYVFFGSASEPYLDAFVPIYDVYDRAIKRRWPLGAAHRLLPMQQRWRPWKLLYFGDPLLRLRFATPARQAGTIAIDGRSTDLSQAASSNPFGLRGLERSLFRIQCLAWQQRHQAVVAGLPGLLTRLARKAPADAPSATELRRSTADLVAWACDDGRVGLDRFHAWSERLLQAGVESPRLSYVMHAQSVLRLRELAAHLTERRAGADLERLLRRHLELPFSKVMYQRIGQLYKPVFASLRDGKQRRRKLRAEVAKRKAQHRQLQGFLSSF